ncbi:endonuclease/exonuclease/phosphatase family protein [Roseiconus nitratireducens]|uniref:Endonuclease/exonuclease/phosphatase family protein n=2 Tax=Roseiconus nitratireducens TaxID=2605748 RepID=A0A5M6D3E3_9BACT|nr:endonuclease/exonuclease/phosphatase family protein [Roseiconus nitratireducens]
MPVRDSADQHTVTQDVGTQHAESPSGEETTIRIATFNVSLYGESAGEIRHRLQSSDDSQARRIAKIVQTVRPDILLVNELDYEEGGAPARLLAENYFAVGQLRASGGGSLEPIVYPYWYSAPSNTGLDSQLDLDGDGQSGAGGDAWGFGDYPGQYAMAVFSRYPLEQSKIRTFQQLLWKDLPQPKRPMRPATGTPFHPDPIWSRLRLSSKNHLDVPIQIGERVLHLLASHPTPPVFDGPEDRNGCRNHDEIAFWSHYLDARSGDRSWLRDDLGGVGGLAPSSEFVIAGDLNADPARGGGQTEAIVNLLADPLVQDPRPQRRANVDASKVPGGSINDSQADAGEHADATADFGRNGLMRVDYVLPSRGLQVVDSGVFWPSEPDPRSDWLRATDHRLVWIEVR